MKSMSPKIVATVLLVVFAILAVTGVIGAAIAMFFTDDQGSPEAASTPPSQAALSAAAEPYRLDLEQAAQQCPTVLTAQRLDRFIDYTTGWDPAPGEFGPLPLSAAGLTEGQHEQGGGGDPSDVPTAINAAATLWCQQADALSGQSLDLVLPAPRGADDNVNAAAVGLAAIIAGPAAVVDQRAATYPQVKDAIAAIL